METVIQDAVDRRLVHALLVSPRASLREIASALVVSENTVARRLQRLEEARVVSVRGVRNRPGDVAWALRFATTPDAAPALARALAARADIGWVSVLSGGTEVACTLRGREPAAGELLLRRLSFGSATVDAQLLLLAFVLPRAWRGARALSPKVEASLRPEPSGRPGVAERRDDALFTALAKDGRMSYARLARATGMSELVVQRRVRALEASGELAWSVDVSPAALGFPLAARLWLDIPPSRLEQVGRAMARHEEPSFVAATTGRTNLVATIHVRDPAHLHDYVTTRLARLGARSLEVAPIAWVEKRS